MASSQTTSNGRNWERTASVPGGTAAPLSLSPLDQTRHLPLCYRCISKKMGRTSRAGAYGRGRGRRRSGGHRLQREPPDQILDPLTTHDDLDVEGARQAEEACV